MEHEEQVAVNKLTSALRTLERFRVTSMSMHNRPVKAFYELSDILLSDAIAIRKQFPDSLEIARWIAKLDEYSRQYHLKQLKEDAPKK
jgi:hypothetical protein